VTNVHYINDAGELESDTAPDGLAVYPLARVRDPGAVVPIQRGGFHARRVLHVPTPEAAPRDQGEGLARGYVAPWPRGDVGPLVNVRATLAIPARVGARARADARGPRVVTLALVRARTDDATRDDVEAPGLTASSGAPRGTGSTTVRRELAAVEACDGCVVLYQSGEGWRPAIVASEVAPTDAA
jgi:hypothetical protein